MSELTFKNPTPAMLMAMADGLIRTGQFAAATEMYAIALRSPASPHERNRLLVRQGLAAVRNVRSQDLHSKIQALEELGPNVYVGEGMATWMKTLPFFDDPRFVEISTRHADLLPIQNWHWNLQTVLWAVRQARSVEGDFVELGVFRGHTTLFCAEYVEFQTWDKRWLPYDTFEGIPEDQLDPGWKESAERTYAGTFSVEEVRERFAAFPNIEVIQGRVPEILAVRPPGPIAFLLLDLNNSSAEIAALEAVFDRISPGGVMVLDDFAWLAARTQYDAEMKWFSERGLHVLALPTGQGVFVKGR